MNYCIEYNQFTEKLKYINDFDEWIIDYNPKDDTLLEFLEQHQDKRIILFLHNYDIKLEFLKSLCDKFSNLIIKFNKYNEDFIQDIEELCFPFFFNNRISTWDEFLGLIDLGVTDIYIVENLGFDLIEVARIAKENNTRIRMFPNVAQSSWADTPALYNFFIRPEDIDLYSQYIDTIEFFYNNAKQLDVYYEIYKINKKWYGPLAEIIIGFYSDLDSRFIIPTFAEKRLNCQKKCLNGGKCKICNRIEDLSKTLENNNLWIKERKEEDVNG